MDTLELNFDELVKFNTRNIHSALLEGGSKKMEAEIYNSMRLAIEWNIKRNSKKKKNDK